MNEKYQTCIEACLECATACDNCATESMHETDLNKVADCMRLSRECIEACYATVRLMRLGGEHATAFCDICAEICDACAEECEKHDMDHCVECVEACRKCAEECRLLARVNA